ncbi:MAG: hypothetical protein FWC79_04360 [Oscillospiraceae bacterium]|nr:hypothetical protein [Oscillospiraceae bacterium]
MDKEKKILEFMSDKEYVPMKAKEMATVLDVPKNEYEEFKRILDKLEKDYQIQVNRKSKYSLLGEDEYVSGIFRGHEKGFGFVKIEGQEEEIYISANQTKNALNGDKVLIEILGEHTWRSKRDRYI